MDSRDKLIELCNSKFLELGVLLGELKGVQDKGRLFDFGEGLVPAHQHPNGEGWVANTATVAASAYVGPSAQVYGTARVSGNALVYGNAWVYGNAKVYGNAQVYDYARVYGDHTLSGDSKCM